MPHIHVIVAMTRHHVIGKSGHLPWRLPADLHLFRQLTLGQTLIGGRRTFAEIGHPLDGRLNLVLSRDADRVADLSPCRTIKEALAQAEEAGREIFCIGGAELYRQMLPLATWLHISWVEQEYDGDVYFPDLNMSDWMETTCSQHPGFRHCTYQRRSACD